MIKLQENPTLEWTGENNMATGLCCPECGEYFGKSKECRKHEQCGNCGCAVYNDDGELCQGEPKDKQPHEEWGKTQ